VTRNDSSSRRRHYPPGSQSGADSTAVALEATIPLNVETGIARFLREEEASLGARDGNDAETRRTVEDRSQYAVFVDPAQRDTSVSVGKRVGEERSPFDVHARIEEFRDADCRGPP
jgi:hypothetical protein